jgi:hypothetical protein
MYLTIYFTCNVESHKGDNDGGEGQGPCGEIHEIRPFPWSPSGVHLPLEIKSSEKFPSIPEVSQRLASRDT